MLSKLTMHSSIKNAARALGLLALVSVSTLSAQTVAGTDNFGDGSLTVGAGQRWISEYDLSGAPNAGAFAESGGTLNYTSTSEDTQFLRWSGINTFADNDFDRDWTVSINVSNTVNPASGYVTAGLQIYTVRDVSGTLYYNSYYAIMTSTYNGGSGVVTEWAKYDAGLDALAITSNSIPSVATSDLTLRLSWDATTNLLAAAYSTDGVNFTTGQTFNLAGAEAGYVDPYNQKLGIELFVRSANGAGGITSGISFDNMAVSVSAVPEPSTYAAIAGALVLGFTVWRRRRVNDV